MFGLLKSKLTSFISSLAGKEEKKPEERKPVPEPEIPASAEPKQGIAPAPLPTPEEIKDEPLAAVAPEPKPAEKNEGLPTAREEKPKHGPQKEKQHPAHEKKLECEKEALPNQSEKQAPREAEKQEQAQPEKKFEQPIQREEEIQERAQPEPKIIQQVPREDGHEQKPEEKIAQDDVQKAPVAELKAQPQEQKKSFFSSVAGVFSQKPREKGPASQPKPQAQPQIGIKQPQEQKGQPSIPLSKPSIPQESGKSLSDVGEKAMSGSRSMAPKIGIGTAIKSFFSNEITIGESEVSDLLSELELSLLEADVAYDVSLSVTEQLRLRLVGMKVPKGEVGERTRQAISEVLESIMDNDRKFDLEQKVKGLQKPVKILFVGPNGAGKTTTMAKVARMFQDSGLSVVFSASDTFRAAAIEQAEVHAGRLGIAIVKSKYGADPSSVAFDAINYARSHSIDVVLIDSAGRQDTNTNLLDELRKMDRVAKPDIKIYIGESIGGNSIIEQIKAFNTTIGLDGAILTKLDCDAKGGTAISISHSTGIPVLYLGVGQAYTDLVPFDPRKIAQEIMN